MRLHIIDGDPDQSARLRGWFQAHPDWTLRRQGMRWHLGDGQREVTYGGLAEVLDAMDGADCGRNGRATAAPVGDTADD